ncbi:MAG: MFS transporter permease [Thermodesulfobacteriota bacterium]
MKEIIIPKEKAVFWLDKNGRWHNQHGEFEHKKIIDYFHRSIQRDESGYYLAQTHEDQIEKVYFPYEDTPLFVFDVIPDKDRIILVLNTKREILLDPKTLAVRDDALYVLEPDLRIKFTDRALMKLSDYLEFKDGLYFIKLNGELNPIPELV